MPALPPREAHRARYAWAGLLAGLLVLTRPSAQAYVPVIALYLLFAVLRRLGWRSGWKVALRSAVVFGFIAVLTVTPWVIRNQIQFGKPVLVTSNGFNLAAIWSPLAIKAGGFVDPIRDPRNAGVIQFGSGNYYNLNEANLDATLRKEGLDGLRANKGRIPSKIWQNVRFYTDISWRANDGPERLDGRNITFRHATLPYVWLMEILGLVGFVLLLRRGRLGVLVVLTAAYMTAVSLITVSPPRLRAPADVLACVAVGVLVAAVLQRRKRAEPEVPDEAAAPVLAKVG